MTASNKWLIGIGAALGVLVAVAIVAAVATSGRHTKTYPENTAKGVVQRYVQALINEDRDKAYGYLSPELQKKCAIDDWRDMSRYAYKLDESQVTLKKVRDLSEDKKVVTVTVTRVEAPAPFEVRPRESSFDQELRPYSCSACSGWHVGHSLSGRERRLDAIFKRISHETKPRGRR